MAIEGEGTGQEGESQRESGVRYSRTQTGDRVELGYELSEGLEGLMPSEMFATRLVMETGTTVVVNRDLDRRFSLVVESEAADLVHGRVQAALEEALGGEVKFEESPDPIQA